jgi:hypothetical protein
VELRLVAFQPDFGEGGGEFHSHLSLNRKGRNIGPNGIEHLGRREPNGLWWCGSGEMHQIAENLTDSLSLANDRAERLPSIWVRFRANQSLSIA